MSDPIVPATGQTPAVPATEPVVAAAAPAPTEPAPAMPAPVPAAQTPSAAPVAVQTLPAEPPRKKRRALGVAALIFALLALVTDVMTLVFGFGSLSQFSDGNIGRGLGLLAGFFGYGLVAVIVGAVLAGIAFVLAIGAMIGGSGRAPGVVAFILSIGELILHAIAIAFIVAIVTSIAGWASSIGGGIEGLPLDQIPGLDQLISGAAA